MLITLDEGELIRDRPQAIRQFLSPLVPRGVACESPHTLVGGGRVWAAHDGQVEGKAYRDWRFSSRYRDIRGNYFELWKPNPRGRTWYLDRAYLTLYLTDRSTHQSRELLGIHADPNCDDPPPTKDFKKGPHLHIKHLAEPLSHAHFPLTIGYVETAIKSPPELTRVLTEIVSLLSVEVVDRFNAVPA